MNIWRVIPIEVSLSVTKFLIFIFAVPKFVLFLQNRINIF